MSEKAAQTKQAPETLDRVQRFVNTRNRMRGYDHLESSKEARRWLEESGYSPVDSVGDTELARLRELREGLRDILLSHNLGTSLEVTKASSRLNDLVSTTGLGVSFDSAGRPLLCSPFTGTEKAVEDMLIAAIRAGYEGTWQRLKACANKECQWIFYDASKNRSGSWCVMEICGSRVKMRSYRERHSGTPRDAS
ncbi:CGNR zinc finger domain-containing protein [Rubrobacter aplysinae]|uniref:CGNR zinc finger domain-containing protein n=1 Tax=Rubrobacter aplysinae TaxID=909625 RepID=UPI00069F8C8B|nr:CGNR zinc finger domain-containing protein [Rubrobacter aplysinae]